MTISECHESKDGYSAENIPYQFRHDVEQRLKELLTFFDRFVANGTGEIVLDQYRTVHGSNG